jgi:hypothetical protein
MAGGDLSASEGSIAIHVLCCASVGMGVGARHHS